MKIFLTLMAVVISTSALASTYDDRENAIAANDRQKEVTQTQAMYIRSNRNYVRRLASFAARHHGLATAVTCKALEAEYNSDNDSTSTLEISVAGLSATVEYTSQDLTNFDGISHEPQMTDCSLEFRDGLACKTWTRDAVHHDEVGYAGVMADCVSPSLKESQVDLGSIL